jgi:hypothetical protein
VGIECRRTFTAQKRLHACCTASRGSDDAGAVRLGEGSGVEAGASVDAIVEDAAGELADRAEWSGEQAVATMTRDAAAVTTAQRRVIALLAWSFLADVLLTLSCRT